MFREIILPIFRSTRLCVTACGIMHPRCCRPSAGNIGQNNCPKHVELTGIINKPLLLHLVGCLYCLYHWCTVKQMSYNEIYLLIKYIKNVLWMVAKRLSYTEDARCLKVKFNRWRRKLTLVYATRTNEVHWAIYNCIHTFHTSNSSHSTPRWMILAQITRLILQFRGSLRNLSSSFARTRLYFTSVREIHQSLHTQVLIKGIHTFTKFILHFILQSRRHAGARAAVLLLSNWASRAGM